MSERTFSPLAPLLAGLLLAACAGPVGPQMSGVEPPSLWSRLTRADPAPVKADPAAPLVLGSDAEVEHHWWRRFGDPTLDTLVAEALAGNQTLAIAKARVEEAEAARGLARSRLLPEISAVGSAQRANQGYATADKAVGLAEIDLKATWELDLFGRNQARLAETTALLQSEEATRQGVRVPMSANSSIGASNAASSKCLQHSR